MIVSNIPKTAGAQEYERDATPAADEPNDLVSAPAQLSMTVTITRKATGKVETFHLTGTAEPESETQWRQPCSEAADRTLAGLDDNDLQDEAR
jgi:hypothetical protein